MPAPPLDPPRIASLVPSITELLFALGLAPWIVARTGFCIHPRHAVAAVPKVGGTKDVKLDALRKLAPTHVIVNVDENEWPTVQALREFVPEVIVTHPCAPQDNLALYGQMVQAFGRLPGVRARAEALSERLRQGLGALQRAGPWPPRRVLYVIWREPWMTVARDTYISRLLATVNWQTWPDVHGGPSGAARYPVFDWAQVRHAGLDAVLLASEPYRFGARHVEEVRRHLPDVPVQLVDGELLSWYGSRAIDGLSYVLALARPTAPGGGPCKACNSRP
ncbi:helical backbone metal receptor [Caldimonas sp.]|uniref:helical backbone metal receptor n=1 Tax=Caldimonas sp. TaxID=2838790 RepID=UPI0029D94EE5|nr:helical backbone metal receptor [Caldimonas manganoxidans]